MFHRKKFLYKKFLQLLMFVEKPCPTGVTKMAGESFYCAAFAAIDTVDKAVILSFR
jgi:hypothetical protein